MQIFLYKRGNCSRISHPIVNYRKVFHMEAHQATDIEAHQDTDMEADKATDIEAEKLVAEVFG